MRISDWSSDVCSSDLVFSWACVLKQNDRATFRLIWGTPAFITTTLGYGLVALTAYALAFWSAPYAEQVLGLPKSELAFVLGANGAVSGFIGVILGGRTADALRSRKIGRASCRERVCQYV